MHIVGHTILHTTSIFELKGDTKNNPQTFEPMDSSYLKAFQYFALFKTRQNCSLLYYCYFLVESQKEMVCLALKIILQRNMKATKDIID